MCTYIYIYIYYIYIYIYIYILHIYTQPHAHIDEELRTIIIKLLFGIGIKKIII